MSLYTCRDLREDHPVVHLAVCSSTFRYRRSSSSEEDAEVICLLEMMTFPMDAPFKALASVLTGESCLCDENDCVNNRASVHATSSYYDRAF